MKTICQFCGFSTIGHDQNCPALKIADGSNTTVLNKEFYERTFCNPCTGCTGIDKCNSCGMQINPTANTHSCSPIKAADYKGKWFILMDEDEMVNEYERKEINVDYVLTAGLPEHIENCDYYGIPAYIGKDKLLLEKIKKLERREKSKDIEIK